MKRAEKGLKETERKRKTMTGWKKKIAAYLSLALLAGVICACGSIPSDQDQIPTEKEETTTDFDSTDETEETLPETEAIDEIKESAVEPETIEETEESIIETETGTESETETILSESETVTVEEVEIFEMDALMYAQANVNIRASYSADSEKLGTIQKGTSIKVTGVTADKNWYRVEYKEAEAFISASYLGLEKPAEEAPAPAVETPAPEASAGTQAPAPVVNPGDEDLPSMEELTGKPSTSAYDINSLRKIGDDDLTAEEWREQIENIEDPTGILGQLHAG